MNWQKRLRVTVCGGMGLPIIDGAHPYFRTNQGTKTEPILLTKRKPSLPPPPPVRGRGQATIEIDLSDPSVQILDDNTGVPGALPRPPMMAPPPARRKPEPQEAPAQPAPPRASEPPRPSPESEMFSLPELIAVAKGEKQPRPVPKPDKRERESSVMRSMAEIQELERQRVAEEEEAKRQKAEDEQSLEANLSQLVEEGLSPQGIGKPGGEKSLADLLLEPAADAKAPEDAESSLLATYGTDESAEAAPRAAHEAEATAPAAAKPEPFVFLDPEIIEPTVGEEGISISIELIVGLPWDEQHEVYKLTGREQEDCERVLPERATMWVLPVPPSDTKDKGEKAILEQFRNETRREFNGKEYYIVEAPFAGARRVARTGCILHVWPENSTDYEFLGEVSGEQSLNQPMTGEWSINMKAHILSEEEMFKYSALLPEGKPVFIHPVPESEGQLELEKSLMEGLHEGRIPRVRLGKGEYFVMGIGTVAEWQEMTFMFPNIRIASRKGEWLGIWPGSETGAEMMKAEHGFEHAFHGPMGPPLLGSSQLITPYSTELAGIKRLYGAKGEKRWLFPLSERVSDFDAETLNFLTVVSCREIELTGITPLISLNGRFYVSLKYAHPDAIPSVLEGDAIRVHPKPAKLRDKLAEMKQKAAERRAASGQAMIVLPPDPEQRKPLLDMFPEGETRYLYFVDPKNSGYVAMKLHVALMRGKEKEVYLVLKEPYENSIAVRRKGIAIYPLE